MSLIFVAYRRGDTRWIAGRIFERLQPSFGKFWKFFGKSWLFLDVETTPPGLDFREYIASALKDCQVLVAVMGPNWTGARGELRPRIFDPDDWVRLEIETAFAAGTHIIPVCVDQTPMPKADDLPESLRPFSSLQAFNLDSGRHFDDDTKRLIGAIARHLGWRAWLRRYRWTAAAVLAIMFMGSVYGATHLWNSESSSGKAQAAVQACNVEFALRCAQDGGAFGVHDTLAKARSCKDHRLLRSDEPALKWKDIWTTSVYSFQPAGGGPGGGLDDDVLKIGGWGDWYFTLIKFEPPPTRRPIFAAIALFSKEYEGASVPIAIDRIIHRWDFPKGGTLWWKDRPGHRAITTDPLPAPRREQWYLIEITQLVHEWLDGKSENNGVQIRPAHDFGSFVFFVSSDAPDKSKIPRLLFCT